MPRETHHAVKIRHSLFFEAVIVQFPRMMPAKGPAVWDVPDSPQVTPQPGSRDFPIAGEGILIGCLSVVSRRPATYRT